MKTLLAAACFAFLLLNAAGVESRRCHCDDDDDVDVPSYKLFLFGDSFADAGNIQKRALNLETRGWYVPCGISDEPHDKQPTGRCSDGMVQSDFIAKILGLKEAPPAERTRREDGVDLSPGINFANSGGGAILGWNLDTQIDMFRRLLRHGVIDSKDLNQSVAFVSIAAGVDYGEAPDEPADLNRYIKNVTDGIADGVSQLEDLGFTNLLVNLHPPIGCAPWNTRAKNYTTCVKDSITAVHNKNLMRQLGNDDSVLLLDLDTVFRKIITPKSDKEFYHRHTPCCESWDEYGFCGAVDDDGNPQYTVCDSPDQYFYWDNTNPTQAGWKAVMKELEGYIEDFLGM